MLIYPDFKEAFSVWGDIRFWFCEPLALEYLAAAAREEGHEVKILDLRLHPKSLDPVMTEFSPDLVGVTGYSMHVFEVQGICRRVKESRPSCFTVVGGHHASVMPEDFFQETIDFIVQGEGVTPFRQLLSQLSAGKSGTGIPEVWAMNGGLFCKGGTREEYDINVLPFPAREINIEDRTHYFMAHMKPIALMRTTEGCVFRCSFCSLWKLLKGKYLVHDNERVINELWQIKEDYIHLVDDEPWLDKQRMEQLADGIKAAGIKKKYFTYCRADTLVKHQELIRKWREIGLDSIFLGIEAVTPRELKEYNKKTDICQIEEALAFSNAIGLVVYCLFIIHPTFTSKKFKRLARFIQRHNIENPGFTVMTPLPGTDALANFDKITEMNSNGRPNWQFWDLQHAVTETTLPKDEFNRELNNLRLSFQG